jgi:hypothetical protein
MSVSEKNDLLLVAWTFFVYGVGIVMGMALGRST